LSYIDIFAKPTLEDLAMEEDKMEDKNATCHLERIQTSAGMVMMPTPQPKLKVFIIGFACYISIAAAMSAFDLGIYLPLINVLVACSTF
jgi:hypothetical protein